jgi:hypothetical protein
VPELSGDHILNNRTPRRSESGDGIGSLNKGLGFLESVLEETDIPGLNWNLLQEDLSLPTAVLYENKLQHNLDWMQRFAAAYV